MGQLEFRVVQSSYFCNCVLLWKCRKFTQRRRRCDLKLQIPTQQELVYSSMAVYIFVPKNHNCEVTFSYVFHIKE
jgi:hypothetical protein